MLRFQLEVRGNVMFTSRVVWRAEHAAFLVLLEM